MNLLLALTAAAVFAGSALTSLAADPVFSGPQKDEKITPFKVLGIAGTGAGRERDPVTDHAGAAMTLVFVHNIERSLLPLLRVVDEYGGSRQEAMKTEVIFLFGDRTSGEERARTVSGSIKLKSPVSLSLDGAEGPGNYGLNKECMMTIVSAKDNKVTANFALVQPGISDAPKIIAAMAAASGDTAPPTVEQLTARTAPARGEGARMAREGEGIRPAPGRERPVDLAAFDLNSEAGLRDAVRVLIGEVYSLRAEVAQLRSGNPPPPPARPARSPDAKVPDDEKLVRSLRELIRPTNDNATVDRVLSDVENYVKGNPDLTKQAIGSWLHILSFGDHYGTPYARKAALAMIDKLKAAPQAPK